MASRTVPGLRQLNEGPVQVGTPGRNYEADTWVPLEQQPKRIKRGYDCYPLVIMATRSLVGSKYRR